MAAFRRVPRCPILTVVDSCSWDRCCWRPPSPASPLPLPGAGRPHQIFCVWSVRTMAPSSVPMVIPWPGPRRSTVWRGRASSTALSMPTLRFARRRASASSPGYGPSLARRPTTCGPRRSCRMCSRPIPSTCAKPATTAATTPRRTTTAMSIQPRSGTRAAARRIGASVPRASRSWPCSTTRPPMSHGSSSTGTVR
ncbi:hypothetical protein D9M71_619020 [compost metagenome]